MTRRRPVIDRLSFLAEEALEAQPHDVAEREENDAANKEYQNGGADA